MLAHTDLPVDPAVIGHYTVDLIEESIEYAADAGVILGQLDPTEVDLTTGLPRWTDTQRALILKFNDTLQEEWTE